MRPYLDPFDHAFANGPVFQRPASLEAARAIFDRPEDGDRLMAVFEAFERGAEVRPDLRLGLGARLLTPNGERRVRIGQGCAIRGIIRCEGQGEATIGDEVYIGDGVIISVRASVEIGDGALLAHGAQVFDNDTHPIDAETRARHFRAILKTGPKGSKPEDFEIPAAPVRIGRHAWLGFNSALMKGVSVGDEAIIAAGAVVTVDVPGRCIAAGAPAQVVKSLGGPARTPGPLKRLFGRSGG